MSKLYNTLEKIRTGEQGGFSEKKSAPARGFGLNADKSKKRQILLLGASALLVLTLVVFFAGSKHKNAKPPVSTETTTGVTTAPASTVTTDTAAPTQIQTSSAETASQTIAPPKLPSAPPAPTATPLSAGNNDLYRQLNDAGLALIQENQHWQGIYSLEQARKQQPQRPEALINMAVALAELGLRAPAKRLFSEAHALAPNHPLLRKNLELLVQANFLDPQWLSSLTAGQLQPAQAAKPQ